MPTPEPAMLYRLRAVHADGTVADVRSSRPLNDMLTLLVDGGFQLVDWVRPIDVPVPPL